MKKKILVFEYSSAIRKLIQFILEERGYEAHFFDTFNELKAYTFPKENGCIALCEARFPRTQPLEAVDYLLKNNIPTIVLVDEEKDQELLAERDIAASLYKEGIDALLDEIPFLLERLEQNQHINVLVVDDSTSFRTLLASSLEHLFFRVTAVKNAGEALKALAANPDIHLMICDYHMPDINGDELIRQVRETHSKEKLSVIGISSDEKITSRFLQAGANDYLRKPFRLDEFYSRIYNNVELVEKFDEVTRSKVLLEQYKRSVDQSSIVTKTDLNGIITYVNDRFCEISGYSREELIGRNHNIVRHPDISDAVYREMWETIKAQKSWRGIIKNRSKEGREYYVDSLVMPILDKDGNTTEYMSVRHDISRIIKQEKQIRKQTTDPLTGMPNRLKMLQDLQEMEDGTTVKLAIVDIDGFNKINDFFGYSIGDRVLIEVAKRLFESFGEKSHIYRIGPDQFCIVHRGEESLGAYAGELERGLKRIESGALLLDDKEVFFSLSSGVSESDGKDILMFTEIALKESKTKRRHITVYQDSFYDPKRFEENLAYLKKLKRAIEEDRVVPFYQPIYNMKKGKVEKYETLIRILDEDGTVIAPFFFLEVAKKAKLYFKLTRIMIEKSFAMFRDKPYEFSINLTIEDILDPDITGFLDEMIERYGIAERLVLEVVESEEIENFEKINEFFIRMKAKGCKIAIDDFGTGYSNFSYLANLKVDYIKLDGSLVKNIKEDKNAELVAKTVHEFCRNINAKTIAEYVENQEIMSLLLKMGVHYAQGYYIGKPSPKLLEESLNSR